MADIITEITLPTQGLLYPQGVQWQNQLRAPRLKDRGLGDTTRKLKLQSNILDKTLVQPLGMSAYDLHTADFIYLNMRQRELSKGGAPYSIVVQCSRPTCKKIHKIDIALSELEIKMLRDIPVFEYVTRDEQVIAYNYITPRIMDNAKDSALSFKEEYPETELDIESLETQELLRSLIKTVDGKKLTYAQTTDYISNLLMEDIQGFLATVSTYDFGVQFQRSFICTCGKKVVYDLPIN